MDQINDEEIEKIIEEIKNPSLNMEEIKAKLSILLKGHRVQAPKLNRGFKVYRGRKTVSRPNNISELGYPPPAKAKINRANRQGVPIFYCANPGMVPLFEMGLVVGDHFVISEWETTAPLVTNHIGYHVQNLEKMGAARTAPDFTNALSKRDDLLQKFISSQFTKKIESTDDYKISIAISEIFLSGDVISAIAYPPVKTKGNGDNFAIKIGFVDKHLQIKKVNYIRVDKIGPESSENCEITTLDAADNFGQNGEIIWRNLDLTKDKKIVEYKFRDGEWIIN